MKTITLINWVIVGIYAILILVVLIPSTSQQDAAGKGMAAGLIFLGFVFLALLSGLNLLPYSFARITAMVLGGLPLILVLINLVVSPMISGWRQNTYEAEDIARQNGSFYFQDKSRQQVAAAIAAQNINDLKAALEKPLPMLNESGVEHTTLLDFAAFQAMQNLSPQSLNVMELLIEKGATFENTDSLHTPTPFRIMEGPTELLAWCLANGANPDMTDEKGQPLLLAALYSGNEHTDKTKKVALLLDRGADPNAKSPHNELTIETSPLIFAVDNELWEIGNLLLDKGAIPDYVTQGDRTALNVLSYRESGYTKHGQHLPTELLAFKDRLIEKLAQK
ncbi:ankyrin repeat domain-containing protein [Spirosoma aerolatum]|uniref:ankyrin repeat domain-containing protein n=1 Tax=Spirosoma aerolatum TaxID=1211326 RepID=UPI0009ACCBE7|nr:ankyrin repeat domain-containing protein [Spirosoma aerolatum]